MEIYLAEQILTRHPDLTTDKILHFAFKSHLKSAHKARLMMAAEPSLERDAKRQAGTHKQRRPRWPELDDDIRCELERNPKASDLHIWKRLTDPCTNDAYYFDEDKIVSDDSGRKLGFSGFSKRVTEVRKKIKK